MGLSPGNLTPFQRQKYAEEVIKNVYQNNEAFEVKTVGHAIRITAIETGERIDFYAKTWKYHAIDINERGSKDPSELISLFTTVTPIPTAQAVVVDDYYDIKKWLTKKKEKEAEEIISITRALFKYLDSTLPSNHDFRNSKEFEDAKSLFPNIDNPLGSTSIDDDYPDLPY